MGYPQYPAYLNISASLEAPERQHNQLKMLSHAFFVSFANQGGCNSLVDSVPPSQINEVLTTFGTIYKFLTFYHGKFSGNARSVTNSKWKIFMLLKPVLHKLYYCSTEHCVHVVCDMFNENIYIYIYTHRLFFMSKRLGSNTHGFSNTSDI